MTKQSGVEPRQGVLTLCGYGIQLAVERGHLMAEDGIADERRRLRFSRVDRDLKRVVIMGQSGLVTLDAIAWLQGVGVPLIHLDRDGQLYFVSSPAARTVAQLRRAQALAGDTNVGFAISRGLVLAKVAGQLALLDQLPDGEKARVPMAELHEQTAGASTLREVKDLEARAARTYWRAWKRVPVRFAPRDAKRRPKHWQMFTSRISPLTDPSPRKAVNPANAVLNYLYAMLEAEATVAALAARLDPALGLLHADRSERASLACDLMEPVRPSVDAFALSLFRDRQFTKDDVFERHDGHCRLLPSITHELSGTAALWAQRVWPVADAVASALAGKPRKHRNIVPGIPMPLVGARRRPRGRTAVVRGFDDPPGETWQAFQDPIPDWRGTRKSQKIRSANRAWDRHHGPADQQAYKREILPRLANVTLRQLGAATGLSKTTCSQIRRGLKVPHPRHWEGLRSVAASA